MNNAPHIGPLRPLNDADVATLAELTIEVVWEPTQNILHLAGVEVILPERVTDTTPEGTYRAGCAALASNDPETATQAFLTTLSNGTVPQTPALYGLALALSVQGAHGPAAQISSALAVLKGFEDPRAATLAGYANFCLGHAKETKRALALAARQARGKPAFRDVQRFCQELLLRHAFGPEEPR